MVELGDKWRDEAASSRCVAEFARFFRVQDLKGYLPEETEGVDNTLFVNNQSGIPYERISFGGGECIGFQPWHSHQHLHIVAAPDEPLSPSSKRARGRLGGGVDVYLPKMYSPLLGTADFKQRLLDGEKA